MKPAHWPALVLCAALGAGLAAAILQLDGLAPVLRLPETVAARLPESGVTHPVTAVLLNFRAYDTLLEVAVLLIALLGLPPADGLPDRPLPTAPDPVLATLARAIAPLAVLVAGYLLWAGSAQPGGAFQAGAVLAAAAVLLRLAGLAPRWSRRHAGLRAAQAAGLAVFLGVAAATSGWLLRYPPEWAGALILAIESALTVSLGLVLASLFLGAPEPPEDQARRP